MSYSTHLYYWLNHYSDEQDRELLTHTV